MRKKSIYRDDVYTPIKGYKRVKKESEDIGRIYRRCGDCNVFGGHYNYYNLGKLRVYVCEDCNAERGEK